MTDIKQIYKNRTEAYALFIQPGGYGVSRSKFYEDCARLKMVQGDKTLLLADLLAYAKRGLETDARGGRSLADEEHALVMRDLDLREKKATVEAKEKAARKDDDRWMEVTDHVTQMAAFAGLIEDTLRQFTTLKLSELIYLAGGDIRRASEFNQGLEDLYASVLTDVVREQTRVVAFENEDEEGEHAD